MSFIKESIKEFDHVVWPTPAETKKYFTIVVSMIVVLTVFLFVVGSIFYNGIFALKQQISPIGTPAATTTSSLPVQDLKLDNVKVDATPVATPTTTPTVPMK